MGEENPFQAPASEAFAQDRRADDREYLVDVARRQRRVLVCLLLLILIYFFVLASNQSALPLAIRLVLVLGYLGLVVTVAVFVFQLAAKFYHPAVSVLFALVVLFPCINLLVLYIVTNKATVLLRKHGVRVGLLGVNPEKI